MPKLKECQKAIETSLEEILPDDDQSPEVCILCNRGHVDDLLKAGKLFRLRFKGGKGKDHLIRFTGKVNHEKVEQNAKKPVVQSTIQIHPETQHESERISRGILDDVLSKLPISEQFQSDELQIRNVEEVSSLGPIGVPKKEDTKFLISESSEIPYKSETTNIVSETVNSANAGFQHHSDVVDNSANDIVSGILNDILNSIVNSNCDSSEKETKIQNVDDESSDLTQLREIQDEETTEQLISRETDSTEAGQIVRSILDELLTSIQSSDEFPIKTCTLQLLQTISQNEESKPLRCKRKFPTLSNEDQMLRKKPNFGKNNLIVPKLKSEPKIVKLTNTKRNNFQNFVNNANTVFNEDKLNMSLSVHYFCILFSTDSVQRGRDDEGVFGFLPDDILDQVVTSKTYLCVYCSREGATTCCNYKGCSRRFHFPCGQENESAFFFYGKYFARCDLHKGLQQGRGPKLKGCDPIEDPTCLCCLEEVTTDSTWNRLISPCCGRHFHRNCIQQMALTYGRSHYQCPQCKDKSSFTTFSLRSSIYIPLKDAEWEMEEHSGFYQFQEMNDFSKVCNGNPCLCKKGRRFSEDYTYFEILPCHICGFEATHIVCGVIPISNPVFRCKTCTIIEAKIRKDGEELARKDFGIQTCFVKAVKLDCTSAMAVVEKSKTDPDSYKIVAPIHLPWIPDKRWNLSVEYLKSEDDFSDSDDSEIDFSKIATVAKKKRGRPSLKKTLSIKMDEKRSKSKTVNNSQVKKRVGRPPKNPSKIQIGIAGSLSKSKSEFPSLDQLKQIGKRNCFVDLSRSKIKLPEGVTSTKVSPGTNNLVSPKIRKQKISESEQQIQICQWMGCFETFDDDEALLRHVVTHAGVKADALTEEPGQKATARSAEANHSNASGSSDGVKKRLGRPPKRKSESGFKIEDSKEPHASPFYDQSVTRSIEKQNEKSSPVVKTPEIKKRRQSVAPITPNVKSGTPKRRGRPPKNNSVFPVSTPKNSVKSADAVQIRIRSPPVEIILNVDEDNDTRGFHGQQETVFVDVLNNVEGVNESGVENNNSAKRQNPFFLRGIEDDSDDDVVVI